MEALIARLREERDARPAVTRQARPDPVPVSHAQQRVWFLDQLGGGSPEYNLTEALRLRGPLDRTALESAFTALVARHESLRTHVATVADAPVQMIEPAARVRIPVEDLRRLDGAQQAAALQAAITREWTTPFDLARGPLLRLRLLQVGVQEHVLLRTLHHIVSDGCSQGVLNREVAALYEASRARRADPLPPLPVQYADFAVWQRSRLNEGTLREGLAYWRLQLAGAPERLALPTDRPRPPVQTFVAGAWRTTVGLGETAALKELAQHHDATLYMTLLAGLGVVLARYSGQGDVVVGSPIANRQHATEGLIGCFVNAVALRLRVAPRTSFAQLLSAVRQTTLDAYRYQDVPFEKVVEAVAPPRTLDAPPIFQVVFTLQMEPMHTPRLADLEIEPVASDGPHVRFDLEVSVVHRDGVLEILWLYNRDLFDEWRIAQLATHWHRVLAAVVADPTQAVGAVDMLAADEERQLLEAWNPPVLPAVETTLIEMFEAQAAQRPDAVAVVVGAAAVSYGALNAAANRLARVLIAKGVGPEAVVGVALERSGALIATLLGIVKAGGAYLPLDKTYPAARLAAMVQETSPRVIVTRALEAARWQEHRVVAVDEAGGEVGTAASTATAEPNVTDAERGGRVRPHHAAYVMYTSGSTGVPKGIVVTHGNVVGLMRAPNYVRLGSETVLLQAAPVAFDASTFEIWGSLLHGGRLAVLSDALTHLEPLGRTLRQQQVTTVWLTAGLFRLVVEHRLADLRGVEQLLAGGDVLPVEAVRQVRSAWPACEVINGYGPTEATTFSCCLRGNEWDGTGEVVPIGRPIQQARVYVLDERLRPVPVGVSGHLYIGGGGVSRGYLRQGGRTAERFVADPYAAPGTRMYQTGDLARWRPNGHLEFLGRADRQIKIRGHRVELSEIEGALASHPAVRQCLAAISREGDDQQLVAYWTAADGPCDAAELRRHLQRCLPSFMVPTAYIQVDTFPLTPNGKIDLAAFRHMESVQAAPDETHEATTRVREVIIDVWRKALGRSDVGEFDNCFDLGAHSLMILHVHRTLTRLLDCPVRLVDLFRHPTTASLSQYVTARIGTTDARDGPARKERTLQ